MAKILITLLGTGQKKNGGYLNANYCVDGKIYEHETSIARVLATHYGVDRIFILGTTGSLWDEIYRVFGGTDENRELDLYDKKEKNSITSEDLVDVSAAMDVCLDAPGSACFLVEYGLNAQELWRNFEKYLLISDQINTGDELYLDITHSFRSLAMMSFQMVQFIEQARRKAVELKGIFYGMFEYSAHNEGITPVVDISILAEIHEWTTAIGYLKYSGNASMFYDLIQKNSIHTDRETAKVFMHLSNNISMGNIRGIHEAVMMIKKRLDALKNSSNPIAAYISGDIDEFIALLDYDAEADFSLALAKWFAGCHNYGMSYLVLADAVISKVCEVHGLLPDTPEGQEEARRLIHRMKYPQETVLAAFAEAYLNVTKIRNGIAHSTSRGAGFVISDINNLLIYIEKIERGFRALESEKDV